MQKRTIRYGKSLVVWGLALCSAVVLASCGQTEQTVAPDTPPSPLVTSVAIEGDPTVTLQVEESRALEASVVTQNGAEDSVIWTVSNPDVVSIDPTDARVVTVTGLAPGGPVSVIASSTFNPEKLASVEVVVAEPTAPDPDPSNPGPSDPDPSDPGPSDPEPTVSSLTVQGENERTLLVSETLTLEAMVETTGGASTEVTWTSEDRGIVSVTSSSENSAELTAVAVGGPITVTATSTFDPTIQASVLITVRESLPVSVTITSLQVIRGSQLQLDWLTDGATSIDILAVPTAGEPTTIATSLDPSAGTHAFAIPASDRQTIRIVATGETSNATDEAVPQGVVLTSADSDPYAAGGRTPDPVVPGSLRAVLADAAPGDVIGFAQDVTAVDLYGVDLTQQPDTQGIFQDAHLILDKDIIISGPVRSSEIPTISLGVDQEAFDGTTNFDGTARDITWGSRVVYVPDGASVTLENLTLSGGTFIYNGGGIRNDGTLVLDAVTLEDNRAWGLGGGVYNTGDLTIRNSTFSDNIAATLNGEEAANYTIRRDASLGSISLEVDNGWGGGLYNEVGATALVQDTVFTTNTAKISGGGIYNLGDLTVEDSLLQSGIADRVAPFGAPEGYNAGAGIYTEGILDLIRSTLENNDAYLVGGALFVDPDGQATVQATTITGNVADYGGGIRHEYWDDETDDNLSLSVDSAVTGNAARIGNDPDLSVAAVARPLASASRGSDRLLRPGRSAPSEDPMLRR